MKQGKQQMSEVKMAKVIDIQSFLDATADQFETVTAQDGRIVNQHINAGLMAQLGS